MRFRRTFVSALVVGLSSAAIYWAEAQQAERPAGDSAPSNPPHVQPVNPLGHLAAQMHRTDMSKLPPGKTIWRQSAGEAAIRAALDMPADFHFKNAKLADLAQQIHDKYKIPFQIDVAAFKDDDKKLDDATWTGRIDKTTLRKALRTILKSEGLAFVVRNDALVITSPEAAETETPVRIYQVHDLVVAPNDPDARPDYYALIDLISAMIAPESWREAGGTQGEIKSFDGPGVMALVVTQTEELHEQIEALLADLREAKVPGLAELQSRRPKPPPEQPFMSGPRGGVPQIGFPWLIQPAVQQPGNQPAGTQPQPGQQPPAQQPSQAEPAGTQPSGTPRQGGGYF